MSLIVRFLLGGVLVCLFSVLGDSFKPKSFAGIFGASPSVALAGLILTWNLKGPSEVNRQGWAMIFGGLAMLAYSGACLVVIRRTHLPPWLDAGVLWSVWFLVAFGCYFGILR